MTPVTANASLAINGGEPVRPTMLPYGRQSISDADVQAVIDVLRSDWLTTGPMVEQFETAFAAAVGARYGVAVANGTAALHASMYALGIGPGDEVIVPAITFAATANAVVYMGGTPVFADVDPDTLLIDPASVEARLSPRSKAIVAVDYAGQPAPYDTLTAIATSREVALVADACHALGATYHGRPVGSLARLSNFSFHPVKPITTGEGGLITTDDDALAARMRAFRNHGITTDHRQRERQGAFAYQMVDLGFNYRLTDLQCALGLRQLERLPELLRQRHAIAAFYDEAFAEMPGVRPLRVHDDVVHAHHLYTVRLDLSRLSVGRTEIFAVLRAEGIGCNVHYLPVYLHPYYRERFNLHPGLCPAAEAAYETILTLPLFASMSLADAGDVVRALEKVLPCYRP